jgi:diguanylate cyclase (GGDEF)-like protein
MSEREPISRRSTTFWAGIGVILATTILSVVEFPGTLAEARTSLMIAGAGLSAWLAGRWPAVVMCGVWAAMEASVNSSEFNRPGILIRYFVMTGSIWFVTSWKQRLAEESRRGRLDPLTGLPNRQAFYERCRSELSRAKRFNRPLTVVLLDGDRFKTLNDQRGHHVGDRALQATAEVLRQTIRRYDFAARLGGDEFVVLFPETAADVAEAACRRLHHELTKRFQPEFSPLSYSMGVVTFPPGDWDVDECLMRTDSKLYDAKRAGTGLACLAVADSEFSSAASDTALPNG